MDSWYSFHIKSKSTTFKWIIFSLVLLIPFCFLYSFVHEFGHYLIAWYFHWEIIDYQLIYFFNSNGWIQVDVPDNTPLWQILLFIMAGSLLTIILGFILLFLSFKIQDYRFLRYFVYAYSVVFMCDLTFYVPYALISHFGDWYEIWLIEPRLILIVGFVIFLYLSLLWKYQNHIRDKINLSAE